VPGGDGLLCALDRRDSFLELQELLMSWNLQ
jgi:hypothetical protein